MFEARISKQSYESTRSSSPIFPKFSGLNINKNKLVVSTRLKYIYISYISSSLQVGLEIKNVANHHLENLRVSTQKKISHHKPSRKPVPKSSGRIIPIQTKRSQSFYRRWRSGSGRGSMLLWLKEKGVWKKHKSTNKHFLGWLFVFLFSSFWTLILFLSWNASN